MGKGINQAGAAVAEATVGRLVVAGVSPAMALRLVAGGQWPARGRGPTSATLRKASEILGRPTEDLRATSAKSATPRMSRATARALAARWDRATLAALAAGELVPVPAPDVKN